jgi:hypothetical protein
LKPLILRCLLTRLEERQVGVREIVDDDQAVLLGSDVLHGLVGVLVLSLGEAHDFIGDLTDVFRRDAPELIDEVPERRRAGAVEAREIVCQIFQARRGVADRDGRDGVPLREGIGNVLQGLIGRLARSLEPGVGRRLLFVEGVLRFLPLVGSDRDCGNEWRRDRGSGPKRGHLGGCCRQRSRQPSVARAHRGGSFGGCPPGGDRGLTRCSRRTNELAQERARPSDRRARETPSLSQSRQQGDIGLESTRGVADGLQLVVEGDLDLGCPAGRGVGVRLGLPGVAFLQLPQRFG